MCEILAGYDKLCDNTGGVETWYIGSVKNIDEVTVTAGAVTSITMKNGKYVYPFNIEMETAFFNDTAIGERANGAYAREQSATAVLHGNTAEMIVNIEEIAKDRTFWIAKLNDGTFEVLFLENGAKVLDDRASGTAYEDMNGTTLTASGKEKKKAPKISSVLVEALLEPVS